MAGAVSTSTKVILASASPRRRELLSLIGLDHDVRPADVDESLMPGESPRAYAERLAREKALAVAQRDAVTIGCDTIVVVDGEVLGKPKDSADATRMLKALSGRSHLVMTAVAVAHAGEIVSDVVSVTVTFRPLSDADIADYIDTVEPMDKAGAYGIQGFGATIVTRVDGDYFAVMGLPLNRMVRLIESIGFRYRFGERRLELAAGREKTGD
jgi:septum formation protein